MPSVSTNTAPSYALAAGAKPAPASRSVSSVSTKDDATLGSTSSVEKLPLGTNEQSSSTSPTTESNHHVEKHETELSNKDKDAASTDTSSSESSASSSSSTAPSESNPSAEASASISQKPSLTPAPVPKINVWKIRQESLGPKVPIATNVSTSTTSAPTNPDNKEKTSQKTNGMDLDSKNWPSVPSTEEEIISEKKEGSSKPSKPRQGKEKWIPYTPAIIMPSKPPRGNKQFSMRNANSRNNNGSSNDGVNQGGDDHGSRGKNSSRGNRNRGQVNGSADKKATNAEQKTWHKKHNEKKDRQDEKEKDDLKDSKTQAKAGSKDSDNTMVKESVSPNISLSSTSESLEQNSSSSQQSQQSSGQPNQQHHNQHQNYQSHNQHSHNGQQPSSKNVQSSKTRSQRPFHANGVHGASGVNQQVNNRAQRNGEYIGNANQAVQQSSQTSQQSGQQGQQSFQKSNGGRGSPRSMHSNPQFQQQQQSIPNSQQQHFGYQQHHNSNGNGNHHSSYQYRRPSVNVSSFQQPPRQFYTPQQDFAAAMFAFPTAPFQLHPAMMPGYVFEPISMVIAQVEYYFSVENLCKDIFLRRNMNSSGLVPIQVLANFNRIKNLTNGDIGLLVEACRQAPSVEFVGNKVRSREHWSNFLLPFQERTNAGKDDDNAEIDPDRRASEPAYQTRSNNETSSIEVQTSPELNSPVVNGTSTPTVNGTSSDAAATKLSTDAAPFVPKTVPAS
ncbi:hypothetical protein V1511DRAFT_257775 [Dipodascopsis uninucleata]